MEEQGQMLNDFATGLLDGWTPTPENANALPEPVRKYIHDLETRCDPAGDVRTIAILRENVRALEAKLAEERAMLEADGR